MVSCCQIRSSLCCKSLASVRTIYTEKHIFSVGVFGVTALNSLTASSTSERKKLPANQIIGPDKE